MTKVIFVRHGQTKWNLVGKYQGQSDIELTDLGRHQAELLAENFPSEKLDAIYSSDLSRAMETANIVGKRFGLVANPEPAFREIHFGVWEGMTYEEISRQWPEAIQLFFKHPDELDIPKGESFQDVQARATHRLAEIVANNPSSVIAVFAHGAVLRTILAAALHIPIKYIWSMRQDNTAVSIVSYDDDCTIVRLLNSTAHLGKERPISKI